MTYLEYLASPQWKKLRKRVLARDNGRCQSCGRRASEVHHGAYDRATMRGESTDRLHSLCGICHEAVTFDRFGLKRTMREVARLSRMLVAPGMRKHPKQKHKRRHRVVPRVLQCGTYRRS